jgi:uncharacterized protein involved in exopolysaccharide biosynthesis
MDDELEIDLRKIVRSLLRRWLWIVGIALLAGIAAFAFTFLQPRKYEAKAVIALTRPLNLPNFDPRYQTINPLAINNKIVSDIALGDEVVRLLLDEWNDPEKEPYDTRTFAQSSLDVEGGQDSTVSILKVRLKDAAEAARLARLWAEEVVKRINLTYSGRDESQVTFFQEQVTAATQRVEAAAKALQEFEAKNEKNALQNRLDSLNAQQGEYLRRLRVIQAVQADTKLFLEQLKPLPKESLLSSQEQTNLFLLQMRIYGDTLAGIASASQYQLAIPQLTSQTTVGEYEKALTAWLNALEDQKTELSATIETLPSQQEELQGKIQALDNERRRLDLEYNLANETLTTLTRKLDEARIAVQHSTGYASIAAYPVVPRNPMPRGTLRNTALATALGAFLAVFGVLVWDWWKSEEKQPVQAGERVLAKEPLAMPK